MIIFCTTFYKSRGGCSFCPSRGLRVLTTYFRGWDSPISPCIYTNYTLFFLTRRGCRRILGAAFAAVCLTHQMEKRKGRKGEREGRKEEGKPSSEN